jgi:hypothetical protein
MSSETSSEVLLGWHRVLAVVKMVGLSLFGVFLFAGCSSTVWRVLFFWIPTVVVSTIAVAFFGLITYLFLFLHFRNQ